MTLKEKITKKQSGILLYGLTPPKLKTEESKVKDIAQKQIKRIKSIEVDGLILYDIQDETSRNKTPRPFPFLQTLAPDVYDQRFLQELKIPKIIYKSIGKFDENAFMDWIRSKESQIDFTVFVGAPSRHQQISLTLQQAYDLKNTVDSSMILGGVTIPERHAKKDDEHIRLMHKTQNGCQFFVSQCVYHVDHAKNFLSDYYYHSLEQQQKPLPIIFTLTPCGSMKTLNFMSWLGIETPKWLRNELKYSSDILFKSMHVCQEIATELIYFCEDKNIPIGFNIESVAIRKEEIEASIDLLRSIHDLLER